MKKKKPKDSSKELRNSPPDPEDLGKMDGIVSPDILASITKVTMGPYPAPETMTEYKRSCPEVYDQIIAGVIEQRNHRIAMEKFQISANLKRLGNSERNQSIISYLAIVGAVALIVAQLYWLNRVEHWATSAILATLAVGGKPVATIIAELISKFKQSNISKNDD